MTTCVFPYYPNGISHSVSLMARTCSNRTCVAQTHGICLTDDHFRKGPFPPQSSQFWRRCSLCRGTRAVTIRQGPSRICSECRRGQELYLFTDRGIHPFCPPNLIVGRDYSTCRQCRASNQSRTRETRRQQAEHAGMPSPTRERRIIRAPRHYDSSPEMDQPRNCERAARNPNHPITFLRDFFDEIDGRQRPVCNACRRQDRSNNAVVPTRRLRDNSYQVDRVC